MISDGVESLLSSSSERSE